MCLHDDRDIFIGAKTYWYSSLIDVILGETMSLYVAINYVSDMGLNDIIFEMNDKCVVDAFNSNKPAISEFGCLIKFCKTLFSFFNHNSHVTFDRKKANRVAHAFVG